MIPHRDRVKRCALCGVAGHYGATCRLGRVEKRRSKRRDVREVSRRGRYRDPMRIARSSFLVNP